MPPTPAPTTSRRTVLAGLGAVGGALGAGALAGCSVGGDGGATPGRPAAPSPDQVAATRALTAVRAARDQVTATVAAHPRLGGRLAPLLAVHRAHETTLADAVPPGAVPTGSAGSASPASPASPTSTSGSPSPTSPVDPSPSPSGTASGSPDPSGPSGTGSPTGTTPPGAPTSTAPAVPRRPAAAVSALVAQEGRLHTLLDDLALTARSGDFARLLASMGAALGQQVRGIEGAGA